MLIGLADRKASGKSTVSKIIIDHGFQRASFAAGLKEYVGKLYGWTFEDLNTQEGKESLLLQPAKWDQIKCKEL